jgi:hypothetical protein
VRRARRVYVTRREVREQLTEDWRRLRAFLKIVIGLEICGGENDDVVHALKNVEDCHTNDWTDLWEDAHVPNGRAWRILIETSDRDQVFRAYEAATLWCLRKEDHSDCPKRDVARAAPGLAAGANVGSDARCIASARLS